MFFFRLRYRNDRLMTR